MSLTPKQQKLLQFIRDYFQHKGYAPTQREIARQFKLKSLGSVQNYLKTLEAKGYLKRDWNAKRSIQVHDLGEASINIPLAGIVAAGKPIEAIEQHETIEVPPSLLKGGENMALRVQGDSMIEDGIHDGDTVIVRKQANAQNGQTVVAMINGEVTVKKFYHKKKGIELHPANETMQPIVIEDEFEFELMGIVVGLIRQYQ